MREAIGMVSTGHSEDAFWESVIESKELDDDGWRRFRRPWRIRVKSSANISRGRNTVVREFLSLPHRPPWLFLVDTDMAWEPDAFERLLLEASPDRIVGGLCFAYGKSRTIIPTIFAAGMPSFTKWAFTVSARRIESCMLYCGEPRRSVWPVTVTIVTLTRL